MSIQLIESQLRTYSSERELPPRRDAPWVEAEALWTSFEWRSTWALPTTTVSVEVMALRIEAA